MTALSRAPKTRACTSCGYPGHNARTCGRPQRRAAVAVRRRRRKATDIYEVAPGTARPLLLRLRKLIPLCGAEGPRFLDSLMLSCYLRGLLAGAEKAGRAAA